MQELTNVNSWKSKWCKNFTRFIIDIRKVLNYFTTKYNSVLGSIATKVIANEVEKNNDRKRYLNCSEKVKTLTTRTSVKLSSKGEATFISYLLFQRLVVLPKSCNMDCGYIP